MAEKQQILTPKDRQQRNHDEMTSLILQVAREVMRERGVADINLQELARRVGMRAPSLYNYFPGRTAIYDALFIQGMQMFRARLETIWQTHGTTWQGLEKIIEQYLEFALESPELYQLLFERPVPGFTPSPQGLEEAKRLMDLAYRITASAGEVGMIPKDLPAETAMNLLMAIMHGFTALHLANEPHLPSGSGRFGSLIPTIINLLQQAWTK
jgi:AcrR family transcriptional regulator